MTPTRLEVQQVSMRCPKCDEEQPQNDVCRQCGVVVAKFEHALRQPPATRRSIRRGGKSEDFPYQTVNRLLLLLFLSSLGLAIWSHWKKGQLPPPAFYDLARLQEPRQTPTDLSPFQIAAQGIDYVIEPLFDYALDGVVVSLHDSDALSDVYHFKDWKDFVNIRDLCVVWGDNVASDTFRDMQYENTTWTCWISSRDRATAARFAWDQLSNNHLLTHDPTIQAAIKSAEIGDQIHLRGQLAKYSHAGGFSRGSSVSRADTGNGACETIYVEDFQVTRRSNPGWRRIYNLASAMTIIAFIGLSIIFFVAPYRRRG